MTQLYCLGTYSNSVKLVFHVTELVECKQSAAEAKEGLRETGAERRERVDWLGGLYISSNSHTYCVHLMKRE